MNHNSNHLRNLVVLFSDIAGSTHLYEKLGDIAAKSLIDAGLELICNACLNQSGKIIKTIGDEVMCVFETPDQAVLSAINMQTSSLTNNLQIRIGLHFGSVIVDQNDLFGDSVNIAARIAQLSKPGQILTTAQTILRLSHSIRNNCRQLLTTSLKGKTEQVDIWEVLWNQDSTILFKNATQSLFNLKSLALNYGSKRFEISPVSGDKFTIGRNDLANLVIDEQYISRLHLKIEFRRDKFILSDSSFNGTFISIEGSTILLHQDEIYLSGEGCFSLGKPFCDNNSHIISYRVINSLDHS